MVLILNGNSELVLNFILGEICLLICLRYLIRPRLDRIFFTPLRTMFQIRVFFPPGSISSQILNPSFIKDVNISRGRLKGVESFCTKTTKRICIFLSLSFYKALYNDMIKTVSYLYNFSWISMCLFMQYSSNVYLLSIIW